MRKLPVITRMCDNCGQQFSLNLITDRVPEDYDEFYDGRNFVATYFYRVAKGHKRSSCHNARVNGRLQDICLACLPLIALACTLAG